MHFHTREKAPAYSIQEKQRAFFQLQEDIQKYSAGAEKVKSQNNFPVLEEFSLDLGFF